MSELFSHIEVGAFAQRLIRGHIDRAYATMSTGSARHKSERLMQSEITDLLGQAASTVNVDAWKSRQGILKGRRIPYLQVDRKTGKEKREVLHGVYRPGEGIHLSCEGLIIESDALPITIYTALQAKLEALLERGVFEGEERPRLSGLIDLSIPGYDPIVTAYETKNILAGEQLDLRTEQATLSWPEFRKEMETMIQSRQGQSHD